MKLVSWTFKYVHCPPCPQNKVMAKERIMVMYNCEWPLLFVFPFCWLLKFRKCKPHTRNLCCYTPFSALFPNGSRASLVKHIVRAGKAFPCLVLVAGLSHWCWKWYRFRVLSLLSRFSVVCEIQCLVTCLRKLFWGTSQASSLTNGP